MSQQGATRGATGRPAGTSGHAGTVPAPVHYRQGDVLLLAVAEVPGGVTPCAREDGQLVLAHGEATGHRHVIVAADAELLAASPAEIERRFIRIMSADALLVHEEHDPIRVPPGCYQVVAQREFAPEEGSGAYVRPVQD